MNEFPEFDTTQQRLDEDIRTLDFINYQIADLIRRKEELEARIKEGIGHDVYGQRTYTVGVYDVTVTTGINYSLDKEEYAALRLHVPECFNPVKEVIDYKIDKQIVKQIDTYASDSEKAMIDKFLKRKEAKLNVKVKPLTTKVKAA